MIIPSVSILFNWRNEVNQSALYPVYIRITIERNSRYYKIPLPQKIRKEQWSGKEGHWIKNSHPFAFEINNKIAEKQSAVYELIKRYYGAGKTPDFESILSHLNRKGDRSSFIDYMQAYINNPPEKLELNTIKKYQTCLLHLKSFKNRILFSDIDNSLIKDFSLFLHKNLNLTGSTVKKYLESLKKIVRNARRENYIPEGKMEFMFDDIRIKVAKPKRTYLEPDEIKKWRKLKFTAEKSFLKRDRDIFLFQIYTGYYYKDLQIFSKGQLINDKEYGSFIVGARDKNGNQTIIPIYKFPYAAQILEDYKSAKNDNAVFDSINFIEEPVYNRNLKQIARLAGISKPVSNKVARHTNAQLWVRFGAEGAILSKMLGHTKQETTRNYYEINLPEIVEGTKRVDFYKMGI